MDVMGILLVSHNSASVGILDTVSMIMGDIEDVYALQLKAEDAPEDLQIKIQRYINKYKGNCVILLDLFGGTPFNVVMKLARTFDRVYAVAGMNVPMLLEALVLRNTLTIEKMPQALEMYGKQGVMNLADTIEKLKQHDEKKEDEEDD